MKHIRALLLALFFAILCSGSAFAVTIKYLATDLSDTTVGEDLWQYDYFVSGYTFGAGQGFTVFFDFNDYLNLESPPSGVNADWDVISIQPDAGLTSDGFYDGLALVNSPSLADAFSLTFVWDSAGSPSSQPFVIYDTNFATLESGDTVIVPEPGRCCLLALAGVAIAVSHRRKVE